MQSTVRHDDTMIVVETHPAVVNFDDILAATTVVPDDHGEPPWESCDGFEHETIEEHRYRPDTCPDTRKMQGCVWCDWDRERIIITLPTDEDYGIYQYLRNSGATKQVAMEAVAAERRRTLRTLCNWYENGWEWYGVRCNFAIGGEEYSASVWGIDDSEYAEKYVREEMARDVTAQLEAAGYTVTGKPEDTEPGVSAQHFGTVVSSEGVRETWYRRILTRDQWRDEWRRNMASQNWRV